MGHATIINLSRTTNRLLHRGGATIEKIVDFLVEHKQGVHASEGTHRDRHTIAWMVEEIVGYLVSTQKIKPVNMDRNESRVYKEWTTPDYDLDHWTSDPGGEYETLDRIEWIPLKKRLPLLKYISH